jgi:prepilin-type N-terminal cleavage/methylation domain-containing protein
VTLPGLSNPRKYPLKGQAVRRSSGNARSSSDAAFSLIELLVVTAALGILGTTAVLGVGQFRADAAAAACRGDLSVVRSASNAFEVKHERYPSSMTELVGEAYLNDYPAGTSATGDGDFDFDPDALPATVTRPC